MAWANITYTSIPSVIIFSSYSIYCPVIFVLCFVSWDVTRVSQEELDKYETQYSQLEEKLDNRTTAMIRLQRVAMEVCIRRHSSSSRLCII